MPNISGKRILVVEDDYLLADSLTNELKRHGAHVLGPAPTSYYAMSILGTRGADGAVLDIRLHKSTVFDLADYLDAQKVPIAFATAMSIDDIPGRFRNWPMVSKPYDAKDLIPVLESILDRAMPEPVTRIMPPMPTAAVDAASPDTRYRLERAIIRALRRA